MLHYLITYRAKQANTRTETCGLYSIKVRLEFPFK